MDQEAKVQAGIPDIEFFEGDPYNAQEELRAICDRARDAGHNPGNALVKEPSNDVENDMKQMIKNVHLAYHTVLLCFATPSDVPRPPDEQVEAEFARLSGSLANFAAKTRSWIQAVYHIMRGSQANELFGVLVRFARATWYAVRRLLGAPVDKQWRYVCSVGQVLNIVSSDAV